MYRVLIKNAKIISGGKAIDKGFIAIKDKRISLIGEGVPSLNAEEIFDAGGDYLSSGFIDVHCHGAVGYDFCDGDSEGVREIAKYKLSEGVTSFLPTTLSLDFESLKNIFLSIKKYAESGEVFSKIIGIHAEGPYLNKAMSGAQNPDFVRNCDIDEIVELDKIFKIKKVSYSPEEDLSNGEFIKKLLELGIVPSIAHSNLSYKNFLKAKAEGVRDITHFCNQISPLHHREIGLLGAGLLDDDVYIELIADKVHVCSDMLKLIFAKKDNSKIMLISDAMRASGMADGRYTLGGLEVESRDGAVRLSTNGALAGSILRLNVALKNILDVTNLNPEEIISCVSENQAKSLGISEIGRLEEKMLADLVVFDRNLNIKKTFVNGSLKYFA